MPNTSPRERQKSARKSSSVKIEKIDEKKAKDDKKDQKLDVSVSYLSVLALLYFYPCVFSQLLLKSPFRICATGKIALDLFKV